MLVVHLEMTCALCGWTKQFGVEIAPYGDFVVPEDAKQHAREHQSLTTQVIEARVTCVINATAV